ncbi:MAG: hypothetical protein Q7J31_04175 [Syntrophales bacterium]|nr:hypothetical protein [Syntrophales bacterium]
MSNGNSATKIYAIGGFFVGAILGFLFRPSVFLIGQLPFSAVITRGANLQGMDQMLIPAAQSAFNVMVAVAIVGTLIGAGIGHYLSTKKN